MALYIERISIINRMESGDFIFPSDKTGIKIGVFGVDVSVIVRCIEYNGIIS